MFCGRNLGTCQNGQHVLTASENRSKEAKFEAARAQAAQQAAQASPTSEARLLKQRPSLVGARTLLGAKGIATRSKDATRVEVIAVRFTVFVSEAVAPVVAQADDGAWEDGIVGCHKMPCCMLWCHSGVTCWSFASSASVSSMVIASGTMP